MSKPFDMELFLSGVLIGSQSTRKRHLRQTEIIRDEIAKHWQLEAPWAWQRKHVAWFLEHRLGQHSEATRYYYLLTERLLARRLEKPWVFKLRPREMLNDARVCNPDTHNGNIKRPHLSAKVKMCTSLQAPSRAGANHKLPRNETT